MMKKRVLSLLLVLVMALSLSVPAFAALSTVTINGTSATMPVAGFCLTDDKADGVTITPQGATYKTFRGTVSGIVGVSKNEVAIYPGSTTLQVSVSGTSAGSQYTVMLLQGGKSVNPTVSTLKYVNQSAGGTLTFTINPMTPTQGNLTVWVTSNAAGFETKKILIGYVGANTTVTNAKNYVRGDADSSGGVNASDSACILQYLAEMPVDINLDAANADLLGGVNASDSAYILQ